MKKLSLFMLMAVGLLISGNAGANVERIPQMKPVPQVVEEVFDDADALAAEDGLRHLPIKEACATPAPQRIAKSPMEVTVYPVSTEAALTQALTDAADGDEIKLTEDIALTSSLVVSKAITLNLGGKNISGSVNPLIDIKPDSKGLVTILGNSVGETPMGGIASSYQSTGSDATGANTIMIEKGSLNVESGTLSSTDTNFPIVILMYGGNALTLGENVNVTCDLSHGYSIYNATNNTSFNIANSVDMANAANAHIVNSGTLNLYGTRTYTSTYSIENSGTLNVYGAITCEQNSLANTGNITFYNGTYDKSYKTLVEANLAEGKAIYGGKTTAFSVASDTEIIRVKNGEYNYTTISQAIADAAVGDELDLNCNQAYTGININKSITLDLNGYILQTVTQNGSSGYMNIAADVSATIIDSKGTGQYQGRGSTAGFWLQNNATLTLDDADAGFTQKQYAGIIAYGTNSTVNIINNSVINLLGTGTYGLWSYQGGNINLTNSVVNAQYNAIGMYGGTLTCTGTDITCTSSGEPYGITVTKGASLVFNSGNLVSDDTDEEDAYSIGVAVLGDACSVTINGGTITSDDAFAITGNGSGTTNSVITINNGTLTSNDGVCIYHPQSGTLTITDGTLIGTLTAIEMRGGNLNISGGTFISTYEGFSCQRNGSGTTTAGAALAIAQHTTKLPINVTISGGHFKGNYPISQCNPQENEAEYVALLDIEVTGGYFWADNGTSIVSHTEDRRLFLKGGVYNLDPSAFTVNGYFSLPNQPELYAGSYAQGYVYKVAQQNITEEQTKSEGTTDWAQNTTWNNNLVPDYATNVTINNNIEVTTPAEANTITINEGSTLTVKDGGTLIIGNGGIMGATDETFKVEAGGQVLIAPNAEHATIRGSVDLLADRAGLKPGETYTGQGSEMYWQHIAIPTQGAPESITPNVTGKTFFNTWDIVKGWQNVGTTALNESFKGYNLGNFHPYSADGSQSITYTFVGNLVGNQPDYMVFAREGHSFFGNSYLAPLDVATMFGTLYNPDLEYTLNIYDSQSEMYQPVNEATYSILGINEIKPLQGFFIYAANATQAQLDYNSAVFTAYLNKHAVGGQTAAPVRKAAKTNTYDKMAQITIAATTGEKDAIYLFEEANFSDAEDNGFDARNLEHSGLDMSVAGSFADLSVLATDNLEGALLNINTNNAVEYTMTFSHVQGDMTLTDNMTGAVIALQEGATYTFAAQPNAQLNGRFAINADRKVPTNMDKVKAAPAAKGIYTIMGQYVGEATNWNALPAGIYIVDGVRVSK